MNRYILDGHMPVKCDDSKTWARAFESDRHVGDTIIGDARISTVFLGLDHQFGDGPPLLFETMIFGGEHDQWQERSSTWEEAEKMHDAAVQMVKGEGNQ